MDGIKSGTNNKRKSFIMGLLGQAFTAHEHERIHNGKHFVACTSFSLSSGASLDLVFQTSSMYTHFLPNAHIKSEGVMYLFEGSSVASGTGIPITVLNRQRGSANGASITVVVSATVTSTGMDLFGGGKYLPAGGGNSPGITDRSNNEFVLKQDTIYTLRILSLSSSNIGSFCGDWYEGG